MAILIYHSIFAKIMHIPVDYSTIQMGVNYAVNGDTILVAPGTYFENISLKGQNIFLSSYYVLNKDTSFISRTIINGSKPISNDTASCILIYSGEDSTTLIQGFTITNGKGTIWPDVEYGGKYREGGGILIDNSSPTIKNNIIINNIVDNKIGVNNIGGGGIRAHHSHSYFINNIIIGNKGNYGGAIALYYSGCNFYNNIIIGNTTGADYGGGNIWISQNYARKRLFVNNTIVGNYSSGLGGGIYVNATDAILYNNIIWGNVQSSGSQISGNLINANYNCTENKFSGIGNITLNPLFLDSTLNLGTQSPCIDAGDTNSIYNDIEDTANNSYALLPSKGNLRNDLGVYGGPFSNNFPPFKFENIQITKTLDFGTVNTLDQLYSKGIAILNQSSNSIIVDSIKFVSGTYLNLISNKTDTIGPIQADSVFIQWTPHIYASINDTILIYHNQINLQNPLKCHITGKASSPLSIGSTSTSPRLIIYPNPINKSAKLKYFNINENSILNICDLNGRIVKFLVIKNTEGNVDLNLDNLNNGIYIYELENSSTTLNGHFLINR